MKKIFDRMNEDKIFISNSDFEIDINKIKKLTMNKVKKGDNRFILKKIIGVAASLVIFITISSVTTYALAGPVARSYIGEILGFETGEVLLVGETISNKDYSMTVEDFIYDGVNGEVTLSVSANSNLAKESFITDKIYDKFGHFGIGYGIGELEQYNEDNKRCFSISFTRPINKYNHLVTNLDNLVFTFDGMKDMIKIPLEETLSSFQKDISVAAQGYYPVEYNSIVYSKLGFTIIGNIEKENESYENMKIDFVLKNGDVINFVNTYDRYITSIKSNTSNENQENYNETIIIDGKRTNVNVSKNTLEQSNLIEGVDFIREINDEWFAGSGGSGHSPDTDMIENSFRFTKAFDWKMVERMIINGTEIEFN
ncbi:DUF4179 domain-containing protein [Clostridium sp.]|uniref:DUF4179 domain-containing protein n=1 Tax=Clostridium sp. TaxID=1506 RepID=UPI0025C5B9CD|nr:DUF4179 domain-containing protein [Clostridium sp.]